MLVAVGVLAWVRVFGTWFGQDDFRWLLRAMEGTPFPLGPRVLSMSLYFRVMLAIAGLHPVIYHAINLGLHVATGVLFFHVMARRLPHGAAAAAAATFLTSPALFDALHWASAIAELLTGALLALALWLLLARGEATGRLRPWLAVAAYALALASKEIAVGAAPVLAILHARRGGRDGLVRAAATIVLAVAFAIPAAGASRAAGGSPYTLVPSAVLLNLPGFLAAAVIGGTAWAEPSDFMWTRTAPVLFSGWALLAMWLAALILRRSKPAWLGFAWFLCLLAPVLALDRQVYFYYVYCALPGLAFSVASLVAGADRSALRPAGFAVAALIVAQCAALEARSTARLALAPLPVDFVLRRATIARNAITDLAPARDALRARVVMLGQQPVPAAMNGANATQQTDYTRDPWWDQNVRGSLSDGEAVRLFHPRVRQVVFKPWLEPEDTSSTIAAYQIDGHLKASDYTTFVGIARAGGAGSAAEHMDRARDLILRHLFHEALGELQAAERLDPNNADVVINLGVLAANLGDSTTALTTLARAAVLAPRDADVLYNLGLMQWRLGHRDEARVTWNRLFAVAPESDLAKSVRLLLAHRAQ